MTTMHAERNGKGPHERASASTRVSADAATRTPSPPLAASHHATTPTSTVRGSALPPEVRFHDLVNLVLIAGLIALNLGNLVKPSHVEFAWFWWATLSYFILDGVFVLVVPSCVKSPQTIVIHHIISGLFIFIPYFYPRFQWCMSYCMLVEINTFLLIAKRNVETKSLLMESLFYLSWVSLRLVLYPWLVYAFYLEWRAEAASTGVSLNPVLVAPIMQAYLCGLNFIWTWDMISKMRKGGGIKML